MMHLIIGRTCSGKSTLERLMAERGLKPVVSRTTRPMRTPDEHGHIFIEREDVDSHGERLTETTIDGHIYFTTPDDLKDKDVYVIDPVGMRKLCDALPDEIFTVVHVRCKDELRKTRYMKRSGAAPGTDAYEKTVAKFESRNADEDARFTEFEQMLEHNGHDANAMPPNVKCVCTIDNDEEDDSLLAGAADGLATRDGLIERMAPFAREAGRTGILDMDDNGRIAMYVKGENEPKRVSIEEMSQCLIDDPEGFAAVMRLLLAEDRITVKD